MLYKVLKFTLIFMFFQDEAGAKKKLEERKRRLSKHHNSTQPLIIGLGKDYRSVDKYLIFIDNFYYETTSAVNAVDICFTSIFATGAKYDLEARGIWQLIEVAFYKLKASALYGKLEPGVSNLAKTLLANHIRDMQAAGSDDCSTD
jgi:hypothetical protein